MVYEFVNGVAVASRRGRIPADETDQAMANLLGLGIELGEVELFEMLDLTLRYNITAYDAAYLALAEREGCDLWTGDRAFYRALKDEFRRVRWIGDYVGRE